MPFSKYKVLFRVVPVDMARRWQDIVNILATVFNAEVGLIMRLHETEVEVFVTSETEGNPFTPGDREKLLGKLYCEGAMDEDRLLYVDDAKKYERWKATLADKPQLTSYLGVPIKWPTGEIFGTMCVLSSSPLERSESLFSLMEMFKSVIEDQLSLLLTIDAQSLAEKKLHGETEHLEDVVRDRTSAVEAARERTIRYFDFMAHDIANILSPAVVYAEMIRDRGRMDGEDSRMMERVSDQLRKASSLVRNIRMLERVGDVETHVPSVISLREVFDGIMTRTLVGPAADSVVTFDMPEGEIIVSGAEYVESVLEGVFENAITHSHDSSAVVDVRAARLRTAEGGDVIRIEISDHGHGIPDATKKISCMTLDSKERYRRGITTDITFFRSILDYIGCDLTVEDRVEGDHTQGARIVITIPVGSASGDSKERKPQAEECPFVD